MKKSELTFLEGFDAKRALKAQQRGEYYKVFDWDKAAEIIRAQKELHPDLRAEAGLQGDWDYTGNVIYENGQPVDDNYTYLGSLWAIPTLVLEWDGKEQLEIECYTVDINTRFTCDSKWDDKSLDILNN